MALFDANSPEFFAPNERADYGEYLDSAELGYEVCLVGNVIIGAFGVVQGPPNRAVLNWIMIEPASHGLGFGSRIMGRVLEKARALGASAINIAASQKSAPFFAKFGARELTTHPEGWGPGLDRVDMELPL